MANGTTADTSGISFTEARAILCEIFEIANSHGRFTHQLGLLLLRMLQQGP